MSSNNTGSWDDIITKILLQIERKRGGSDFVHPVEHEKLGLNDYLDIVKKPMCIEDVKRKIENKEYSKPDDCAKDVRLIWSNAMHYNVPGSVIYNTAKSLSDFWESQWAPHAKDDTDRPPNDDDMKSFADACFKLPPEELGKVVALLEKHCPSCLEKRNDQNELMVNIDLIPGKAFREAKGLVSNETAPTSDKSFKTNKKAVQHHEKPWSSSSSSNGPSAKRERIN